MYDSQHYGGHEGTETVTVNKVTFQPAAGANEPPPSNHQPHRSDGTSADSLRRRTDNAMNPEASLPFLHGSTAIYLQAKEVDAARLAPTKRNTGLLEHTRCENGSPRLAHAESK